MMTYRSIRGAAWIATCLAAGLCQAQTAPTDNSAGPSTAPATQQDAQQEMNDLLAGGNPGANPVPGAPLAAAPGGQTDSSTPGAAAPLPIDATSGSGAVAPGAPPVQVLREGSFIVNRIGRLSHTNDGSQMQFTFDSDGRTMKDPPLLVLPNLKLMQMESALDNSNRDLRFRVSGMVTEYKGRNYVLLDKFVVVPDIDNDFMNPPG